MAKYYASAQEELRARQRSLIPLNIFVAILALVAALSLLFLPLVSIHVDDFSALTEMMGGTDGSTAALAELPSEELTPSPDEGEEGAEPSPDEGAEPAPDGGEEGTEPSPDEGSEETAPDEGSGFDPAVILDGIEISVSVTGMDLIRIGFAESPEEELYAMAGGTVAEISDDLASRALTALASETPAEAEDVEAVREALVELEAANSDAEADAAISEIADVLVKNFTSEDVSKADLEEQLRILYDETTEANDGAFTTEALLCVLISQASGGEEGAEDAPVATTFDELFANMLSQGGENGEGAFGDLPSFVFPLIGGVGIFFAGIWGILFLFAFFHIFAKNKRFMMWYVKLFGFLPCLIFGVAPLLAGVLLPAEAAAGMGALLGMVSTMTWVSGACYLLLWIVSIFWAFPIKRKIRRLNRMV